MLETLTNRLENALRNVRGVAKLSEKNMADTFKDVRAALLTADVHFRVAREFIDRVSAECIGQKVTQSLTPDQMLIKIIHDELVRLLGEGSNDLVEKRPLKIMMIGLHGSGKTTSSVKLARYLQKKKYTPLLVACDLYRPAAIEQLETLARNEDFHFFAEPSSKDVSKVATNGITFAKKNKTDAIIFDTAGRLQIDEELLEEIKLLKSRIVPDEILLVADSALGQEAVNISKEFHESLNLTGIILTKLDGDARGGAALSMKAITNIPIKFIGTGEKVNELELFHPDRMASRILGMGDVITLVEKAQETINEEEASRMAEKMRKADFNYEDMLTQFKQLKKMGSLGSIVDMLPGMNNFTVGDKEEDQLKHTEAIIFSMTRRERQNPNLLNGRRRMRIAKGSGVEIREVNALIKQFTMMRKMMKKMKGAKGKKMLKKMQSMGEGTPGIGDNYLG